MSESLSAAKRALRQEIQARRRRVESRSAVEAGKAVRRHLETWPAFVQARRVALYAALADELPTRPSFDAVVASGRDALLPRVDAHNGLEFCPVSCWEELEPGRYGVLTPPPAAPTLDLGSDDLVLVPGVAFGIRGERLGRGGGVYDRAFGDPSAGPCLCGVAYELQLVETLPHGSHDRRMDAIVTERGVREWTESG